MVPTNTSNPQSSTNPRELITSQTSLWEEGVLSLSLSLICCTVGSQLSLRRNCSVCQYIFDMFIGGVKFSILSCHHLGPNSLGKRTFKIGEYYLDVNNLNRLINFILIYICYQMIFYLMKYLLISYYMRNF